MPEIQQCLQRFPKTKKQSKKIAPLIQRQTWRHLYCTEIALEVAYTLTGSQEYRHKYAE
jgi:hypothetical protein